jgi:hypothetical protein
VNLTNGKKFETKKLQPLFNAFNHENFSQPGYVVNGVFLVG